jgi:hypothetical protein
VRGNWAFALTAPSVNGAPSSFVIVTVCAAPAGPTGPPNSSALAEAARSRPVPVSAALVSVGPLVATVSVAAWAPVAVGEKATATVQVCPWLSVVPAAQVPDGVTNPGPSSRISWTTSGSVPVLVTVWVRAVPGPASIWRLPALKGVAGDRVAVAASSRAVVRSIGLEGSWRPRRARRLALGSPN